MRRPCTDGGEAECNHDKEKHTVPPVGDALILSHHFHVVVIQSAFDGFGANPDLFAVEKDNMYEDSSDSGK